MSNVLFDYLEVHAVDHCNNNCRWCNNHSPFSAPKEYAAGDYIPWMNILRDKKISFRMISVMGGEPFLHSDLIGFVHDLKSHFPDKVLAISTNGFWLSQEEIDSYSALWTLTDVLFLSLYPNLLSDTGGVERALSLVELIKRHNPQMSIDLRSKDKFRIIDYPKEPTEPPVFCGTSECTTLLADGRLARCGLGGYAHLNPNLGEQFLKTDHMFFDLKMPSFTPGEFWHWRRRWPLDSCYHCTSYAWEMSSWKAERGTRRHRELEIEAKIRSGERLMARSRYEQARNLFRFALGQGVHSAQLHNLLAVSLFPEDPQASLAHFARALELDPGNPVICSNIAAVRKQLQCERVNGAPL